MYPQTEVFSIDYSKSILRSRRLDRAPIVIAERPYDTGDSCVVAVELLPDCRIGLRIVAAVAVIASGVLRHLHRPMLFHESLPYARSRTPPFSTRLMIRLSEWPVSSTDVAAPGMSYWNFLRQVHLRLSDMAVRSSPTQAYQGPGCHSRLAYSPNAQFTQLNE